jgi:hypothetical protein
MNDHGPMTLTDDGTVRRASMREALLGEFTRVHARRLRRVRAVAAGLLLAAATGMAFVATPSPRASTMTRAAPAVTAAPRIAIVQRSVELERYVRPPARRVAVIDDGALVETLERFGRPAGVIRMGERVRLTRDIADPFPGASDDANET